MKELTNTAADVVRIHSKADTSVTRVKGFAAAAKAQQLALAEAKAKKAAAARSYCSVCAEGTDCRSSGVAAKVFDM